MRTQMLRTALSLAIAASLFIFASTANSQDLPEPLIACIARYEKLDQQIKWIRLDTTSSQTPTIPLHEFYELNGVFDFAPIHGSLILASDGRTFQTTKRKYRTLSAVHTRLHQLGVKIKLGPKGWWPEYAQAKEEFANVEPEEEFRAWVYDGKDLWDRRGDALSLDGKPLDTLSIVNVDRLKSTFFETSSLQYFLITFPIPSVPLDDARRKSYRIVDLARDKKLKLLSEADEVNGFTCLKLAFDKNTVWLAPKLNYALVKLQSTVEGHLVWEIDGVDYKNWGDDFWFPTRFTTTSYGYPNPEIHPPRYLDKELSKNRVSVTLLRINDPADEKLFTHGPEASDLVMDEVMAKKIGVQKQSRREIPTVGYQAPANAADLEKTRDAAVARAAAAVAAQNTRRIRYFTTIAAGAGGFILIISILLAWRARRRHLAETTFEYKP